MAENVQQNRTKEDALEKYTEFENTTTNIAVTGRAGSGKSSFINTLRGIPPEDERAAAVGCLETTDEPTPYDCPLDKNVIIHDLPGSGTTKMPIENYVEKVNFDLYDFFLILVLKRFTTDDLWLAKAIKSRGKKFFFVRTHVDVDVANERQDHPTTFNETNLLAKIRKEAKDFLNKEQTVSHQMGDSEYVYLISTKLVDTQKWEYSKLVEALKNALPETKRQKLTLAVHDRSVDSIKQKVAVLRSQIWWVAILCGATDTVLPEELSDKLDIKRLVLKVISYSEYFGIEPSLLEHLLKTAGDIFLSKVLMLAKGPPGTEGNRELKELFTHYATKAVTRMLPVSSPLIPFLRPAVTFSTSFVATYKFLDESLKTIERIAIKLLAK